MARNMTGDPDKNSPKTKPTYDQSVKLKDPGGANASRPNPSTPYRNPDPKSKMLGTAFDKASC